jgi:hypothetical protein
MRGLDPRIHEASQQNEPYGVESRRVIMDRRVKPGNDAEIEASLRGTTT